MKREDRERFEGSFRALLERVPTLRISSFSAEKIPSSPSDQRADGVVELSIGNQKWTLIFEIKKQAQPRQARNAALQLRHYIESLPGDTPRYGVLLAPFISEESARICEDVGIGYADLAGNSRLSFDHVFIETRSPENPFREKRETHSLFAPRSTRILRTLLQGPLRAWKVMDLASSAQVSLGLVSAVRKQLLLREWAKEEPGGLVVTKPDTLLDAWVKADEWDKRTAAQEEYSTVISDPTELALKIIQASFDGRPVFTQGFAGWLRHPYTTPTVVTAYVKDFPAVPILKKFLLARPVPIGSGRVRLVKPVDEGVFLATQSVEKFRIVSDVQIYLDLQWSGMRGDEQGEELRQWSDFSGGWR